MTDTESAVTDEEAPTDEEIQAVRDRLEAKREAFAEAQRAESANVDKLERKRRMNALLAEEERLDREIAQSPLDVDVDSQTSPELAPEQSDVPAVPEEPVTPVPDVPEPPAPPAPDPEKGTKKPAATKKPVEGKSEADN